MNFHILSRTYLRAWLENRIRQAKRNWFKLPSISHFNIEEIKAEMEEMDRRITNLEKRISVLENVKRQKIYEFDWRLDLYVRSIIWELRDIKRGKPAKKIDVLNTTAYLGMERERVEQAINELDQMGQIIVLKGGDTDWDRLKVVDEERFYRYMRIIAEDRVSPED